MTNHNYRTTNLDELLSLLNGSGLIEIGEVTIFGSFMKTAGKLYNDIDLYIDAPESARPEVEKVLEPLPFDVEITPPYYSGLPKPFPRPPFPREFGERTRDILHVTLGPAETAKRHPFYQTMKDGKHLVLSPRCS